MLDPLGCKNDRQQRNNGRAALLVQVDVLGQEAAALGKSQDLSESGIFVRTTETLEPLTEVVLRFALPIAPEAVCIQTHGVVARALPGVYMAIVFMNLPEEHRRAIERYVKATSA
ncbi:MAG: hypothetical protein A3H27_13905 [Acidobacteria bacterium RIFCSPLOWO2_02_FULL_59_13]|nr:MAG: hypothetical protein A3J28_03840 [Acidobacteria bacterium RIFCSPLOWO2_12_FULL_60_22]OFW27428.1 MAG: hypothetical protein A3H27_13905 [Acidobacteria bacterium RIFCSPLOWO2_02_FULL_59_13]